MLSTQIPSSVQFSIGLSISISVVPPISQYFSSVQYQYSVFSTTKLRNKAFRPWKVQQWETVRSPMRFSISLSQRGGWREREWRSDQEGPIPLVGKRSAPCGTRPPHRSGWGNRHVMTVFFRTLETDQVLLLFELWNWSSTETIRVLKLYCYCSSTETVWAPKLIEYWNWSSPETVWAPKLIEYWNWSNAETDQALVFLIEHWSCSSAETDQALKLIEYWNFSSTETDQALKLFKHWNWSNIGTVQALIIRLSKHWNCSNTGTVKHWHRSLKLSECTSTYTLKLIINLLEN